LQIHHFNIWFNLRWNGGSIYSRIITKTILYGNNAFMHKTMVEKKEQLSWLPFTEAEIDNLPYVKN